MDAFFSLRKTFSENDKIFLLSFVAKQKIS